MSTFDNRTGGRRPLDPDQAEAIGEVVMLLSRFPAGWLRCLADEMRRQIDENSTLPPPSIRLVADHDDRRGNRQ